MGLGPEQVLSSRKGVRAELVGGGQLLRVRAVRLGNFGDGGSSVSLHRGVNRSTALVAPVSGAGGAADDRLSISNYIDRYIVDGISLHQPEADGDHRRQSETTVEEDSTPEFSSSSGRINLMVRSIRDQY